MADTDRPDIAAMSFEAALKELEGIVRELEQGQTSLDHAIDAYERGAQLKKHCEEKLAEARMRVEKITLSGSGQAKTQPFDAGGAV